MERLWAPWRMDYITSDAAPGCIFCAKTAEDRDLENLILKRGELAFIMMNAFPYNNGHLMVATYRHIGDISDLTDEEILGVFHMVNLGKSVLADALGAEAFNIGINLGRAAGAGITDHIHVHIVPRWEGDTNFMPVMADTKVMPQALAATYKKLRGAM